MACVRADGSLTVSGRRILAAVAAPATPAEVAQATEIPLYRVRGALRELVGAGLAAEADGRFAATETGARLAR